MPIGGDRDAIRLVVIERRASGQETAARSAKADPDDIKDTHTYDQHLRTDPPTRHPGYREYAVAHKGRSSAPAMRAIE